ncbi:hypothetical protein [uncultured Gammaproteobacteria bacterium]|nr:hypothetical protein [uncultured Gammaproteobacteria bacterium]
MNIMVLKIACPHYSASGGLQPTPITPLIFCPHYFPSKSKKSDLLRFFVVI